MTRIKIYDLNTITGRELFEVYTSVEGEYGQTLLTAYTIIGDDLFPMLEECHRTGKKIDLKITPGYEHVYDPPLDIVIE
ncbi:MAG: hypothetical protein PHD61_05635 [Bacteroidales bacterium]|nr:hypothetical protein [Lentimicrobiaceae bacterium]MDD5694767.1 hypothetical protein [Bacteroidales bacterium]